MIRSQLCPLLLIIGFLVAGCAPRTSVITGRVANPHQLGSPEMVNFNMVTYSGGSMSGGGMYERNVYLFEIAPVLVADDGVVKPWKRRVRWVGDPFVGGDHFRDEVVTTWQRCRDRFAMEIPNPEAGWVVLVIRSLTEPGTVGCIDIHGAERVNAEEILIDRLGRPAAGIMQAVEHLRPGE